MMHRRSLLSLSALLVAGGLAASTLPSVAGAAESAAAAPRPGLLFEDAKGTYKARGNASGAFKGDLLVQKVTVDRDKRNLKVLGRISGSSGGVGSFDSQAFSSTADLSSKGTSSGTTCG